MGQQQLLLLVLSAVIVGLSVVVGINMFQENSASANQDAITQDLMTMGARAQAWFRKPASIGGGGRSFAGLTANAAGWNNLSYNTAGAASYSNDNATYVLAPNGATDVTVTATSQEDYDGDAVNLTLTATATPDSVQIAITTAD